MRYRLALLMLLAMLPAMAMMPAISVLAAPVPDPSAILDIGPPPKGQTAEEYYKDEIDGHLIHPHGQVFGAWLDPEVKKLPSVAALKDARSWLSKNIRIRQEGEGRRLRLTFRAGNRREQVTILNTLLRVYIQTRKKKQQFYEERLRWSENRIPELEQRIASGQFPRMIDRYRKAIDDLRSNRIPACRAEIARRKQIAVIKWAE